MLNGDACAELLALVDAAQLPAVVTLMGKGCLPDSHPLNYGAPGHARLEVRELGAEQGRPRDRGRLALRRPRHRQGVARSRPGAKVIHFDIDAAEVGKIRHAEIPVVGPLKLALAAARRRSCSALDETASAHAPWLRQLEEWREPFPFRYRAQKAC